MKLSRMPRSLAMLGLGAFLLATPARAQRTDKSDFDPNSPANQKAAAEADRRARESSGKPSASPISDPSRRIKPLKPGGHADSYRRSTGGTASSVKGADADGVNWDEWEDAVEQLRLEMGSQVKDTIRSLEIKKDGEEQAAGQQQAGEPDLFAPPLCGKGDIRSQRQPAQQPAARHFGPPGFSDDNAGSDGQKAAAPSADKGQAWEGLCPGGEVKSKQNRYVPPR